MAIKHVIGDYLFTSIENQLYVFHLDGSRLIHHRQTGTKSIHFYIYFTDNYAPVSGSELNELEKILKENNLPKMNMKLFGIFKALSVREKEPKDKEPFEGHDLDKLIESLQDLKDPYSEQAQNMIQYIKTLNTKMIVTPVKRITEFIEEDLIATSPAFMGNATKQYVLAEELHKKVTNVPITGKAPWMKTIVILMMIGVCLGAAVYLYQSGALNGAIPGISFGGKTSQDYINQYKTPEALKAAIDRGEVKYSDLPPDIKKMVDQIKIPTTPIQPNTQQGLPSTQPVQPQIPATQPGQH